MIQSILNPNSLTQESKFFLRASLEQPILSVHQPRSNADPCMLMIAKSKTKMHYSFFWHQFLPLLSPTIIFFIFLNNYTYSPYHRTYNVCVYFYKVFFFLKLTYLSILPTYLPIYLSWLRWVFIATGGLSLVAASGGYSSLRRAGFSLRWLLLLRSMGSRRTGFSSCGTWAQ